MMGPIQESEAKLFHYGIILEKRVRPNNPLRAVAKGIDFGFVREEVKNCYGKKGHESEDPIVIMKLMLLLFLDDHPSERELMRVVEERLDYLWFLGLDLEDEVPDHSVLSKARRRWGREIFEKLFIQIARLCVESGLVDGKKIYMDGTLINGNAAKDAVTRGPVVLIEQLREVYEKQEKKLNDVTDTQRARTEAQAVDPESPEDAGSTLSLVSRTDLCGRHPGVSEECMLSKTDPDTAVVRKGRGDGARPRYKNHRVVDDRFGVITALETTAGDIAENTKLIALVQQHETNTGLGVDTVVADNQYGTNDNFAECQKRGIRSHMGDLKKTYKNDPSKAVFSEETFQYDAAQDVYNCPAGQTLQHQREDRGFHVYGISGKICRNCYLRDQCTRSKTGRTIKRHPDHEQIQRARQQSHSRMARQDRRRRRYLMEGSFADASNNHGLKRARWRGLQNQQTQDYLIATCQNIRKLLRLGQINPPVRAMQIKPPLLVSEATLSIRIHRDFTSSCRIEALQ
jgi:transposase